MSIPISKLKRSIAHLATQSLFYGADTLGWMTLDGESGEPKRLLRDVRYADRPGARLDVIRPAGEGPFPVVFHVHGGGFTLLSKDTHWMVAETYARRGYLVVNVNYRLAPEHPFPAAPEDVADAYRWMIRNVGEMGGDLDRLVLAGESAGANLILGLAVSTTFEREELFARRVFGTEVVPRAIAPASGLLQVSDPSRIAGPGPLGIVARREVARIEREYLADTSHNLELADPLLILESTLEPARPFPATFVSYGGADPIADDSRRLQRALASRGVRVRGNGYDGETHSFHVFLWREKAKQAWQDTFEFLDDALASPSELSVA